MSVLAIPNSVHPRAAAAACPSLLAPPPHPSCHGPSLRHQPGQAAALAACPGQPPAAEQHQHPRRDHRQRLRPCPAACSSSPAQHHAHHLGWNANFASKFTLGPVLGRGSFGTVHEAVHNATGASYAVKVLQKAGRPAAPAHLEAIRREASTWALAQRSKFVAKLQGLYEDEEHAYLVCELCTGGDLKALLEANGCFSEQDTAVIMRGVLDVLTECHERNICYGDVKPANFLMQTCAAAAAAGGSPPSSPQGGGGGGGGGGAADLTVRAIDFGCSRVVSKAGVLTQQCGTPLYMAPEMALQRFGRAVDVWAAGVMMYQMLTGTLPFWPNKTAKDISHLPSYDVLAAIRTHEVYFCRERWSRLTPEARHLVTRMLDPDPSRRITAAQALSHPWLQRHLGYTPQPSGVPAASLALSPAAAAAANGGALLEPQAANNVVELRVSQHGAPAARTPAAAAAAAPAAASVGHACAPLSRAPSAALDDVLAALLQSSPKGARAAA